MAETLITSVSGIDAYASISLGSGDSAKQYSPLALTSFSVSYPLGGLPTAQIRPAIGQPLFTVVRKSLNGITIPLETCPVQIYMRVQKGASTTQYLVFDGLLSSISAAQSLSGSTSSAGLIMNCVHKASILATIPPAQRYNFNPNTCLTHVRNYEQHTLDKYAPVADANTVEQKFKIEIRENCMEGMIALLKYFYSAEQDGVPPAHGAGDSENTTMKTAMEGVDAVLSSIKTDGMTFAPSDDLHQDYILNELDIWGQMNESWSNTSGWQLLQGFTDRLWGSLVLTADQTRIIPNVGCLKTVTKQIKAADIFGANRNRPIDPVTVKGIALMAAQSNANDAANPLSEVGNAYYIYPDPPKQQGMYMFAKPPPWMRFYLTRKEVSTSEGATASDIRRTENPEGSTQYSNKEAPEKAPDEESKWYADIAKAMYGEYRWMRDSMALSISLEKFLELAPGQLVNLDPRTSSDSYNNLFNEAYVGQIKSMDLTCFPGQIQCNVMVANIRSVSENDEYALEVHPVYTNFKMSDLDGMTVFKKE